MGRVGNWRAKWAVKLKRYIEEMYAAEFSAKELNREVELLLQGEDPYAAMAAAAEAEAAEKEEGVEVKDEAGVAKREIFEPASAFAGARPGWAFKMGSRGLGYYRDAKQEAVKAEKKEEKKEKGKAEPETKKEKGKAEPEIKDEKEEKKEDKKK